MHPPRLWPDCSASQLPRGTACSLKDGFSPCTGTASRPTVPGAREPPTRPEPCSAALARDPLHPPHQEAPPGPRLPLISHRWQNGLPALGSSQSFGWSQPVSHRPDSALGRATAVQPCQRGGKNKSRSCQNLPVFTEIVQFTEQEHYIWRGSSYIFSCLTQPHPSKPTPLVWTRHTPWGGNQSSYKHQLQPLPLVHTISKPGASHLGLKLSHRRQRDRSPEQQLNRIRLCIFKQTTAWRCGARLSQDSISSLGFSQLPGGCPRALPAPPCYCTLLNLQAHIGVWTICTKQQWIQQHSWKIQNQSQGRGGKSGSRTGASSWGAACAAGMRVHPRKQMFPREKRVLWEHLCRLKLLMICRWSDETE